MFKLDLKSKKSKKPGKWTIVDPSPNDLAQKMSSQDSVTTQLSSPSFPHEESVLEHYFELLSQSNYDKAKELVDSEKDGHKFSFAASWGETLQCLSQLATAEKYYSNLVFLGHKRFTQIVRTKDSARSIYTFLLQEFQRMESALTPFVASESEAGGATALPADTDQLLAHISGQLCCFLKARIKMIEFYEQLASLGAMRQWINFEDLVMMCQEILKDHVHKGFHHPLVVPLRTVFSLECESLCHLLQTQILMSSWSYLPCVLQLHQAHSKLNTWVGMIPTKEVKSAFGRSSGKSGRLPPLYNWLYKLKGILLSKFGLYFYDVLAKQTIPAELKNSLAKTPEDFVGRVQVFQKKTDASNIYLVLDSHDMSGHVGEGGYQHPEKYTETAQGIKTYPPIFSYPQERTINQLHWHNIIMLINSNTDNPDKIKFFYERATEERPQSSYFIIQVDTRISMVVIFDCKKNEKDSGINCFMTELASQLRCQSILASLKNFAKS